MASFLDILPEAEMASTNLSIRLSSLLSSEHNIPVLITNQIYVDVESGNFQAYGGYFLNHSVKTILALEKIEPGKRLLKLS